MKRRLSMLLCILLSATFMPQNMVYADDLRGIFWGMSRAEVVSQEGRQPDLTEDDCIAYDGISLGSVNGYIVYFFDNDDRCYGATFVSSEDRALPEQSLEDYYTLQRALEKQCGEILETREDWSDQRYTDVDLGIAVMMGAKKLVTAFEDEVTDITLAMTGENNETTTMVVFQANSYTNRSKAVENYPSLENITYITLSRSPSYGARDEITRTSLSLSIDYGSLRLRQERMVDDRVIAQAIVYVDPQEALDIAKLALESGFFSLDEICESGVMDGDITEITVQIDEYQISVWGICLDTEGPEAFRTVWQAMLDLYQKAKDAG